MASGLADKIIADKQRDRDDAWFERASVFAVGYHQFWGELCVTVHSYEVYLVVAGSEYAPTIDHCKSYTLRITSIV